MKEQRIEDIYPLSPMQKGMLFHSLQEPGTGSYWQQINGALHGVLDTAAFARAWETVIDRHAILRTAFEWEDLDEPLQVVCGGLDLPLELLDWRGLPPEEQERRLEDLLPAERLRGSDLQSPPLMRLVLIRREEEVYQFVWTFHHILLDGWCSGAVVREVFAFYDAYRAGRPLSLEPPTPYRSYIAWLLERDAARSEAYWRRVLAGFGEPTPLPRDEGSGSGHSAEALRLPPDAAASVTAMARRLQITLNTVAQAAWSLLLSHYSGEKDVVFGSVVSGRPAELPGVEGIIGLFVNTIPVRIRISYESQLSDFLRDVQRQQLEAREHEHSLLADIQGWSEVPQGQPLFESLLVFQNFPVDQELAHMLSRSREVSLSEIRTSAQATFPLTFSVSANAGLALRLEYDGSRFQQTTIRGLLNRLEDWLTASAAAPERLVADISWLTAVERHQILLEWNDTVRSWGADLCVHELVEAQAARSPEAVALLFQDREMTYRELDRRANALARHLRGLGVRSETIVAISAERSPEMVIALLGILKAGGAYLPLDPGAPQDRQDLVVRSARPAVLVTAGKIPVAGESGALPRVELSLDEAWLAGEDAGRPSSGVGPDNLAYAIYTSGSTGHPKGVMISHRSIANRLLWTQSRFPLAADDCLLQKTPFIFDASVWEIFVPLLAGARLALAEPGGHQDSASLLHAVAEHRVTTLQLVPSMLGVFLYEDGLEEKAAGLRRMFCGGEVLSPALAARFFERLGDAGLCNLYGPTEVSIDASSWTCRPGEEQIPIGRPLDNMRIYVLAPGGQLTPAGALGILHAGGVGLARGYLGNPGLTAERFVPDPFGPVPGGRLYDTGDLVRRRPDGALEYVGRLDHQVKVRGVRIELGEIEAALARHEAVQGAVVLALEASVGGRRLVAYVAHGRSVAPQVPEMRSFLTRSLPESMVPAVFVFLESLPRTPGGKVDRRALPAVEAGPGEEQAVAPRSPVEEVLAEVWGEVLGIPRPGAHDNFFDLGGHSLLATQVISRVRKIFQLEVPLHELFEAPTVAAFAARVTDRLEGPDRIEAPPIEPVSRDAVLPLSFAQQRLWFLHQMEPDSPAYNIPLAMRLLGRLNIAVLEACLGEVVRRHEGLRTTFRFAEGEPAQSIAPSAPVHLPWIDLQGLPEAVREREVLRLTGREAERPFDLETGPLLRLVLLRSGEEERVLLLTLHHTIADGWSLAILVREVAALYEAFLEGRPSPLPELPIQYADYAHWQRRWLQEQILENQLSYWREKLSGAAQLLELPSDRPRPLVQSSRGAACPVALPPELLQGLKSLGREEGVTLFMTLLGAFQALLGRYSGQSDLCIGTPVAGRNRLETENLVGLLLNALVLRGDLSGAPGFRELLSRVRETTLGAYTHQDLPFELLVEELKPERSLSHAPLYQVMLILQNTPQASFELPGLKIEGLAREHEKSNLDLTLNLAEAGGRLMGSLEYSTELFDEATLVRLLGHFEILLRGIVSEPDLPIPDLPLIAPEERGQLLWEWNRTERDFPLDRPFHEIFADQVGRTPRAVAAACGTETWTYTELDLVSSRLARHLGSGEDGPEPVIALLTERSLRLLASMLAVWKAGGVYLPLDPLHPPRRLAQVLARSGAVTLLAAESSREAATAALAGLPVERRPRLLTIETLLALPESAAGPEPERRLAEMAYIIFTSGSTGVPKGVMVEHRGMINHLFAKIADLGLKADDRVAQTASQTFDISLWQFLAASLVGGRVQIFPDEVAHDTSRLADEVERARVSILETVPSLLHALLLEIEGRGDRRPSFSSLRWLIPTGEALAPELCRRWLDLYPGVALMNAYGPTECSDDVTHASIHAHPDGMRVPIGSPVANLRIYVLDRLEPVPVGVAGELMVGGVGVGRGYLADPARTAESFIPDPFGGEPGSRLYRTGDRARRLPDGALDFLGRIDQQVKIRGFRIELGEIEAALNGDPRIRQSAVLVRGEIHGNRLLVAYVVPAENVEISPAELRASLKTHLPEHMVPAAFVVLESLPLAPSGKLDRRALSRLDVPASARSQADEAFEAPRTSTEELLAGIWGELLGLARVGRTDDFFELGGHSLMATRVLARLRQVFRVDLPLRALFEAATLAELAGRVEAARRAGEGLVAPPIERVSRGQGLPLSFAQQRLWFLDQLEPGSPFYNIPLAMRMTGPLALEVLERAMNELVRRHEVLRTSFAVSDGQPVQVIAPFEPVPLPLVDLSALPPAAREDEIRRRVEREARHPFDLGSGRPFRWTLLRISLVEQVGLFTLHHVASDEWSMGILMSEVTTLVGAFSQGRPSPLPELPIQYADYAAWQWNWLTGAALDAQLAYWRRQLAGDLPVLALPTDHPRAGAVSFRGRRTVFSMPPGLTRDLNALSRREGATLFMTLLAAFNLLLYRYTSQEDLIVGTAIAGRDNVETLIGFFINMLALRTRLSPGSSFRDLLRQVREVSLGALAHQEMPFDKLVEELQPDRQSAQAPIFQVAFGLRNAPKEAEELPGLAFEPMPLREESARFDLTLWMAEGSQGLNAIWTYRTDLFEDATIERMNGHLQTLLQSVVDCPEAGLDTLEMYSEIEKERRTREERAVREASYQKFKSIKPKTVKRS